MKDLDGSECKKKECKKCKRAVSYRRKLVRWLNLAAILTFRDVGKVLCEFSSDVSSLISVARKGAIKEDFF